MNILVCISKAPDTTTKIAFTENSTKFNEAGVQFIVNPYDEWYALVRALELKEAHVGKVSIINVGLAENDAIIRKALAIGADEAIRIDASPEDAFYVATQIANHIKSESYDMVLLGKETIDYNGSQLGSMMAGILDLPYISLATSLDVNGNTATLERDIQGGSEIIEVDFPFVASAAKGMAEQRIPNMRGIMAARTKPLKVIPATETAKHTKVSVYELPAEKGAVKLIDAENPSELLTLLHKEAKVI